MKNDTDDMKWEFRIIKSNEQYDSIDGKFSVQECLLDEHGVLLSHTLDFVVSGENIKELKQVLTDMLTSLDKNILGEIRGINYE